MFMDVLRTQLILKGVIAEDEWPMIKEHLQFDFMQDGHFTELKNAELLQNRLDMLGQIESYVGTYFSKEYVRKHVLRMSDEEVEETTDEEVDEAKTKPAKGKRFAKKVKNPKTGRTRTVSYGQAGKAKKGGDRIRPGTAKGHAYCARSAKIKKCKNPPCANALSRKKWKCQGSRSVK